MRYISILKTSGQFIGKQGDRKGPHPAPHHPRPYYEDERIVTRHVS